MAGSLLRQIVTAVDLGDEERNQNMVALIYASRPWRHQTAMLDTNGPVSGHLRQRAATCMPVASSCIEPAGLRVKHGKQRNEF
jgi:hypothetical protein